MFTFVQFLRKSTVSSTKMDEYSDVVKVFELGLTYCYHAISCVNGNRITIKAFHRDKIKEAERELLILQFDLEGVVRIVGSLVDGDVLRTDQTALGLRALPSAILFKERFDCNLREFLADRPRVCHIDFWKLAACLANSVSNLRSKGVIIRDLCPENIQIELNADKSLSRALISEFGNAKVAHIYSVVDNSPPKNFKVQDLRYLAPELLADQTVQTYDVDTWSLGAILLEAAAGVPLIREGTAGDETRHLQEIFNVIGLPLRKPWNTFSDATWSAFRCGPCGYETKWPNINRRLVDRLHYPVSLTKLLQGMLSFEPGIRTPMDDVLTFCLSELDKVSKNP